MIGFDLFIELATYYFVMFVTPGPNKAMMTASGIRYGFKKTIPHMMGIPFGHIIQIASICLGLGIIFQKFPQLQDGLKWIGTAYLFYLAWKMIGSFDSKKDSSARPLKFHEGALFQIVNPKAWVIATNATVLFFPQNANIFLAVPFMCITAFFVCLPCISIWALFGSQIRKFLGNTKFKMVVEIIMAGLLILTGILILKG